MSFERPDYPNSVITAAKAHALAQYPNECCGLVINNEYIEFTNASETPTDSYVFPEGSEEQVEIASAVIHSHPDGNNYPSKTDMESQIAANKIYGIIKCTKTTTDNPIFWGDFRLEESLIGREFIHGINDCYSIIRAYFWQVKQIKLIEIPRNWNWWEEGEDLYIANFKAAGFSQITESEAVEGDCFLGKILSDQINHGGIYLGKGKGLHILTNRLSRREPINNWTKYISYWMRYTGEN